MYVSVPNLFVKIIFNCIVLVTRASFNLQTLYMAYKGACNIGLKNVQRYLALSGSCLVLARLLLALFSWSWSEQERNICPACQLKATHFFCPGHIRPHSGSKFSKGLFNFTKIDSSRRTSLILGIMQLNKRGTFKFYLNGYHRTGRISEKFFQQFFSGKIKSTDTHKLEK